MEELVSVSLSENFLFPPELLETISVSTNAVEAGTSFGILETVSLSRSDIESDSGDLANGRYRR